LAWGKRPPHLHDEDHGPTPNLNQHSKSCGKKWWAGQGGANERSESAMGQSRDVEDKINALAEALGMPTKELASAIAGAVKKYVPPASLSSISSAAARETGRSSEAAKILWDEQEMGEGRRGENIVGDVFGRVVGTDEPPEA